MTFRSSPHAQNIPDGSHTARLIVATLLTLFSLSCTDESADTARQTEQTPEIQLLSDDASWCWFQDERAVIDDDQILFSGVTSNGATTVSAYHIPTGERQVAVMNDTSYVPNDHNVGALLIRPDGRYLTVYAGHNSDHLMRYRISEQPGDISEWGDEQTADVGARNTYSNVYRLGATGQTWNFHRGIGWNPNYMISEDEGETWSYGGRLLSYAGRPYVRYTSDNHYRIHFITTEGHPRDSNNSIYHGFIEFDHLFTSDGQHVGPLSTSDQSDYIPQHFTKVYSGDAKNVAWTSDIRLDQYGHPYIAFSVTKDPAVRGLRGEPQPSGFDHRYHYARWDGKQWHEHEIAYGGTHLYQGENEYTGNMALHPDDPDRVYISTDVDPVTGEPLISAGEQRYEIFEGVTSDRGITWNWTAITEGSDADNIRPIVVSSPDHEAVIWLNGRYTTYRDYELKVLGVITSQEG